MGYIRGNRQRQDLLPKTTVILEPGDSLYNPPWAWHRVKNTADAQTKLAAGWTMAMGDAQNAWFIVENPLKMPKKVSLKGKVPIGNG